MSKTFTQDIKGYWRDVNKGRLPSHSGVYFVYTCVHNVKERTVTLKRLIYIGTAENIHDRIKDHEKYEDWKRYLKLGEELCFSCTEVDNSNRERVEAAYIFKHQPPVNTTCKSSFNYDTTRVISTGETSLLNTDFTIYRTLD